MSGPIVIDARHEAVVSRRSWSCDDDTAALVSSRWKEYFPAGGVEMGDSARGHLD